MNKQELAEDILNDFKEWVKIAISPMEEGMGVLEIVVKNFENKISNLIKIIEDGE